MHYFASAQFLFGGAFFLLCGLVAGCLEWKSFRRRLRVHLKVVKLHPETGKRGTTYLHPEYQVVAGPHAGHTRVSTAGTYPPLHNENELVAGYLDETTGELQSIKEKKWTVLFISGLLGLGASMLALGVYAVTSGKIP